MKTRKSVLAEYSIYDIFSKHNIGYSNTGDFGEPKKKNYRKLGIYYDIYNQDIRPLLKDLKEYVNVSRYTFCKEYAPEIKFHRIFIYTNKSFIKDVILDD